MTAVYLTLPTTLDVAPKSNPTAIAGEIAKGADLYFGTLMAVNNAKYAAALAKAQNQALVNQVKAGGQAGAEAARVGLPSPGLLIAGVFGLAALLLLRP